MNAKNDQWTPCPHGEIGKMVQVIRTARQKQALARLAVVVVFALALGVGIGTAARLRNGRTSDDAVPVARMSCEEAARLFAQHQHGTLDEVTARRVANHLDHCPGCRRHYHQMKEKGAKDTTRSECAKNLVAFAQ